MQNTFYDSDENYYLEHHGILGMKWGKQNGPPYPLDDKKHDRIVKKEAKRRAKIEKDPKLLYKYSDEFTDEELRKALSRIDLREQVKSRVPEKEKKTLFNRKEKKAKLNAIQKKIAENPKLLEKHMSSFTEDQLELALKRLDAKQKVFEKRMSDINKPKKIFDTGIGYLDSVYNMLNTFRKFSTLTTPKLKFNDAELKKLRLLGLPEDMKPNKEVYNVLYGDKESAKEYLKKLLEEESK